MSWWQLDSVLKEIGEYQMVYKQIPPMACPFDGEPLRLGPPQDPDSLFCPWGDYYYPRDYNQDRDQGM